MRHLTRHAAALVRFAGVGLVSFLITISVLASLHELAGLNYLLAYAAAFVVSSTCGYLLNRRFTFRADGSNRTGLLRYTLVNVGLVTINGAALRVLVEDFHLWYLAASVLLAMINTPVSYVAHLLLSYRLGLRQDQSA